MSSLHNFTAKISTEYGKNLCKSLVISALFLSVILLFLSNHPCCQSYNLFTTISRQYNRMNPYSSPTNLSHLVFGIAGSSNTWANKKWYILAWWRPNIMRGYMFLDRVPVEHLPWPPNFPPYQISDDNLKYKEYNRHAMPFAIRMVRIIEETFNAENDKGVRWYVMADDDTVLLIDNLVDVLSKYDHNKYFYIGMNSECLISNDAMSFEMAFGGAGYALSYPLAKAVAKNLDLCIKRYPTLFGSDHILQSCIADMGVSLTQEKGFHQIDLRNDISGFLSAHPQSPFLSLHHLDAVDPIFPSMNHYEAVNHLMQAAKLDQSRLLQQSICYKKQNNWTFSVSWGYSIQIYEKLFPPSQLFRPIETFKEWRKGAKPAYMFNTRIPSNDPCEAPHVFFFDSIEEMRMNHYTTSYTRRSSTHRLPACVSSGNYSADHISKIRVLSPVKKLDGVGTRRECCDLVQLVGMDSLAIKLRECMQDEIVA